MNKTLLTKLPDTQAQLYGPMDVSLAQVTTDGGIEVASQFSCMRRQDSPDKKSGTRGYVCKFGLDRSGPSWLSSIAVSLSARPAVHWDLKLCGNVCKNLMWKCSQKVLCDVHRNSDGKQTSRSWLFILHVIIFLMNYIMWCR